jgi:hypothetical protein
MMKPFLVVVALLLGAGSARAQLNDPLVVPDGFPPPSAMTGVTQSMNRGQLVTTPDGELFVRMGGSVRFTCALTGLAATLTQCQAAPSGPVKLYITGLYVQTTTGTAGSYSVQTGFGTNCASSTAPLFPANATSARFVAPTNGLDAIDFNVPIAAPTGNAICVIGTATNTINIQIVGYVAP